MFKIFTILGTRFEIINYQGLYLYLIKSLIIKLYNRQFFNYELNEIFLKN